MNITLLLQNVARHITLSAEEQQYLETLLQPRRYEKKEFLLREGEVCTRFTFVTTGCARSFLTDRKGDQHILTFAPADWWVADIGSYISQTPGNLFIEAIAPTTTLELTRRNQETLLQQIPQFERYFRILTERAFAVSQQRIADNLSLTAAERLDKFLTRYPTLAATLEHQQIAAYIGVTPAFFSRRLKSRLTK